MPANLTTLASILKEDYVIAMITDELNNSVEVWKEIEKRTLKWEGADAIFPLRVSRNASVSAASSSNTPTSGQQGYVRLVVTAKKVYGTMQIEGVAIAAAKSQKGAFAQQATAEMDGLIDDFRKQLASFTFTGGPVIGYIWQKKNEVGAANWQYAGRTDGIALGAGETVDIVRMDTYATVAAAVQVNAISSTTINLGPLDTSPGALAGLLFAVVVSGAQAALTEKVGASAAVSAEPQGFIGNLSSQSHFGISRQAGGTTVLRSNFRHCGATNGVTEGRDSLQLIDMQWAVAQTITTSGKRPSAFWLSWMQLTSYTTLLQGTASGNVRVDADSKGATRKADPGYTDFAYAGIPFKASDVCPDGIILALNAETFKRATLSDGEWIDFGSGPIERVPNTDDGTATYRMYYDLVCLNPNANAVLSGVTLS